MHSNSHDMSGYSFRFLCDSLVRHRPVLHQFFHRSRNRDDQKLGACLAHVYISSYPYLSP